MSTLVKIHTQLWLLFFMATIVVIGLTFQVVAYFPVYALSFVFPRLKGKHDTVLVIGIGLLMRVQPWFNGDIKIDLPVTDGRGILLVSNHRSHLDAFILLSQIRGIRILAKGSLMRIPFLSFMMRTTRQIGVERGRLDSWMRAMDEVKLRLKLGERVHVFPEMTRCPPGFQGLQPFTAGPFLAAMQENAVVVPLVFQGTDDVWPRGSMGLNFRRPVTVRTLAPLNASDFSSVDRLRGEVHRRIEAALL